MKLFLSPHNDDSVLVYALVDEFGEPRYVGQTAQRLSLRLSQHQSAARRGERPVDLWLRSCPGATIIPLELRPVDPDEAERRWIRQMREGGRDLVNVYDGGRRAPTGYRHLPESRQKMSERLLGVPLSEEHREKLSAAHVGKPLSSAHREAIGRGGKGLKRSEETRARLSASKTGDRNPMSRVQREARAQEGGGAL